MTLLIAGLLAFFAVHLLPTLPARRAALVGRLGANGYKALFSLLSLAALSLIVIGKGDAAFVPVWTPPPWTRHVTMALMLPVLWLWRVSRRARRGRHRRPCPLSWANIQ